jgi:hypothetical protein
MGAPPEPPARFEPLPREALLAPPCPLVVVAGERSSRSAFAAALAQSLASHGMRAARFVEPLEGVTREELTTALATRSVDTPLLIVEGGAVLGLYRATLAVLVGVRGSSSPALRALRERVDLDVESPGSALAGLLAARLALWVVGRG